MLSQMEVLGELKGRFGWKKKRNMNYKSIWASNGGVGGVEGEIMGWKKRRRKNESQEYLSLTRNMSRKMAVSRKLRVEESVGDLPSLLTDHDCHLILIHKSSFKLTLEPSSELSHENGHKSSHLQLLSLYSSSWRSGLALKCRPFRQNSSLWISFWGITLRLLPQKASAGHSQESHESQKAVARILCTSASQLFTHVNHPPYHPTFLNPIGQSGPQCQHFASLT